MKNGEVFRKAKAWLGMVEKTAAAAMKCNVGSALMLKAGGYDKKASIDESPTRLVMIRSGLNSSILST